MQFLKKKISGSLWFKAVSMFKTSFIEINRVALILDGSLTQNPPQTVFKATEAFKCTSLAFSVLIWGMRVTLCIREHVKFAPYWPLISLISSTSHKWNVEDRQRAENWKEKCSYLGKSENGNKGEKTEVPGRCLKGWSVKRINRKREIEGRR